MKNKTREEKIASIIFGIYGKDIKEKKLSKMGVAKNELEKIKRRYKRVVTKVLRKAGKKVPAGIDVSFEDASGALKGLNLKPEMRKLYLEMFEDPFETLLKEASKEITGLHTIVVKDGNNARRFTFQSHKLDSLKKELNKAYGSKAVTKIASAIKKAESNGKLKFFANDDAVDFEVKGDKVTTKFRVEPSMNESVKELKIYLNKNKKEAPKWAKYAIRREDGSWFWRADKEEDSKKEWTGFEDRGSNKVVTVHVNNFKESMNEANIEIKDKNASNITVDGKPYLGKLGGLKADYPKHFAALRLQLKKDGKTLSNFGGDDPRVDIAAKADGTISVNYDA